MAVVKAQLKVGRLRDDDHGVMNQTASRPQIIPRVFGKPPLN
jgi:hypothetical protein